MFEGFVFPDESPRDPLWKRKLRCWYILQGYTELTLGRVAFLFVCPFSYIVLFLVSDSQVERSTVLVSVYLVSWAAARS